MVLGGMIKSNKQIGKTKNVGFEFGIRKTFSIPAGKAWNFLLSKKGLKIWLGTLDNDFKAGEKFKTKEGIEGLVRIYKEFSHLRINWKKKDWENTSTVQVRVLGNSMKSTISFHQEKLLNSRQRNEMRIYWNNVLNKVSGEWVKGS